MGQRSLGQLQNICDGMALSLQALAQYIAKEQQQVTPDNVTPLQQP